MPKINLTPQTIKHLAPGEYFDTNTNGRGLILRVLDSGTRRFEFRYRFAGKNKRFNIGEFPDMKLAKARDEMRNLKNDVNKGMDPQFVRDDRKRSEEQRQLKAASEKTFSQLVDEYKGAEFQLLRRATREEYQRIIDEELLPAFGPVPVKDITTSQITALLDKKAFKNGSPTMANRIRSRLHTIFAHGVGRCITENPVSDTSRYKGEKTSERTYEENELVSLWEYYDTLPEPVKSYLKILTLTGQRRSETMNMQWNHIRHVDDKDIKGWVWVIPSELSKSGRQHEVPLSDYALEIIKALPRLNSYVFASFHTDDKPIALSTVKRAVKNVRENCLSDFKLHDVRRTVSTQMAKMGIPQEVTSKILNHKSGAGGALAKIYNRHEYRPERQQALNRWATRLETILKNDPVSIHQLKVSI